MISSRENTSVTPALEPETPEGKRHVQEAREEIGLSVPPEAISADELTLSQINTLADYAEKLYNTAMGIEAISSEEEEDWRGEHEYALGSGHTALGFWGYVGVCMIFSEEVALKMPSGVTY